MNADCCRANSSFGPAGLGLSVCLLVSGLLVLVLDSRFLSAGVGRRSNILSIRPGRSLGGTFGRLPGLPFSSVAIALAAPQPSSRTRLHPHPLRMRMVPLPTPAGWRTIGRPAAFSRFVAGAPAARLV